MVRPARAARGAKGDRISLDNAYAFWVCSTGNRLRASPACARSTTEMACGSGRRCSSRDRSNLTTHAEHHSRAVRPVAPSMHAEHQPQRLAMHAKRCCRCRRRKDKASPARHGNRPGAAEKKKSHRDICSGTPIGARRGQTSSRLCPVHATPKACHMSSI